MTSRRIALVLSLVAAAGGFAACGDDEGPPANPSTSTDGGRDGTAINEGGGGDSAVGDSASDTSTNETSTDAGPDVVDAGPQPTVINVATSAHDRFNNVAYDAAGNIYVLGIKTDGTDAAGAFTPFVAKFSAAGVLDSTFGTAGYATAPSVFTSGAGSTTVRGLVLQSDGKIVIAGSVPHAGAQSDGAAADPRDRDIAVVRFKTNGQLDETFGSSNGIFIHDVTDGVVSGTSFVSDNQYGLALAQNDKLVVSGSIPRSGATDSDWAILRLNANGTRDNTFNGNGLVTLNVGNVNNNARNVSVLADDSVVLAGYFTDSSNVTRPLIWKVSPTGGDSGMPIYIEDVLPLATEAYSAVLQDASFVTTGYGRSNNTEQVDIVSLRVNDDGGRDMTYGGDGGLVRIDVAGQADQSRSIVVLPDRRIVLVGMARKTATDGDALVVVLSPDGQPDTSFAPNGRRIYDLGGDTDFFSAVAISPDGKNLAVAGIAGAPDGGDDNGALLILPTGL